MDATAVPLKTEKLDDGIADVHNGGNDYSFVDVRRDRNASVSSDGTRADFPLMDGFSVVSSLVASTDNYVVCSTFFFYINSFLTI